MFTHGTVLVTQLLWWSLEKQCQWQWRLCELTWEKVTWANLALRLMCTKASSCSINDTSCHFAVVPLPSSYWVFVYREGQTHGNPVKLISSTHSTALAVTLRSTLSSLKAHTVTWTSLSIQGYIFILSLQADMDVSLRMVTGFGKQ